jgi:hypothetical protein
MFDFLFIFKTKIINLIIYQRHKIIFFNILTTYYCWSFLSLAFYFSFQLNVKLLIHPPVLELFSLKKINFYFIYLIVSFLLHIIIFSLFIIKLKMTYLLEAFYFLFKIRWKSNFIYISQRKFKFITFPTLCN